MVTKYDAIIVIPFSMVCCEWLNPTAINAFVVAVAVDVASEKFEENMFGVGAC